MDLYMIISSLLAGLLGSMGFGGGSVLIIYLVNFLELEQKQAQGINLVFFIPCALLSVITYKKRGMVKIRNTLSVTAFAILGSVAGFIILNYIPTHILTKFFGAFLLIFGLWQLFRKVR
ncbi:MAG: sulfite exporter TauE/SafE family protein [Clostridia bacterium]|nr:sulfite exporter TauE/SafE family protein [Clostridia bacterium]